MVLFIKMLHAIISKKTDKTVGEMRNNEEINDSKREHLSR